MVGFVRKYYIKDEKKDINVATPIHNILLTLCGFR